VNDLLERSLRAQLKAADRAGARWVLIVGEEEAVRGVVAVRDLRSGRQDEVPTGDVVEVLSREA
jgi:histidyl-tRNA synthetase